MSEDYIILIYLISLFSLKIYMHCSHLMKDWRWKQKKKIIVYAVQYKHLFGIRFLWINNNIIGIRKLYLNVNCRLGLDIIAIEQH